MSAQGWSEATTLGVKMKIVLTLKGFAGRQTLFRVLTTLIRCTQGSRFARTLG